MAIARCSDHPLGSTKQPYNFYAHPLGFPQTAAICGRPGCENPALVWLEPGEVKDHKAGQRVFGVKTHSIRVQVGAELIPK